MRKVCTDHFGLTQSLWKKVLEETIRYDASVLSLVGLPSVLCCPLWFRVKGCGEAVCSSLVLISSKVTEMGR